MAKKKLVKLKPLPDPKGWPIVGSFFQMNPNYPIQTFRKWQKEYGDIYQVHLGAK